MAEPAQFLEPHQRATGHGGESSGAKACQGSESMALLRAAYKLASFGPIWFEGERKHGRRSREVFAQLQHAPGPTQADFGEAIPTQATFGNPAQSAFTTAIAARSEAWNIVFWRVKEPAYPAKQNPRQHLFFPGIDAI